MRYVKAAALVGGVCLLGVAVTDTLSRRADAADATRANVEVTTRLEASRLDARIAGTAAALAGSPEPFSIDRLSRTLDQPVCVPDDTPGDGAPCGVERASLELVLESAAADGTAAAVVDPEHVAVGVDRDGTTIVSVVPVPRPDDDAPSGARLHAMRSSPDVAAEPDTEFVSGRWVLTIDEDSVADVAAFGVGGRLAVGLQALVGLVAAGAALVAFWRDHRGLRRQATTDSLTGLPNRSEFERRAGALLARAVRDGTGACLMLVDLDRFKAVNDNAGHAAGDRVLIEAAGRLRRAVRETDVVGRWGGDEFVVLLAGVGDPLAVPDRVAAIAAGLRGIPTTEGDELTASVGAAVAPLDGTTVRDLLEVADRAMYRNKPAASRVTARRMA